MKHVQMSNLVKLFTQNKKDRIEKFDNFAQKINVTEIETGDFVGIIRPVDWLAPITVAPNPRVP